MKFSPKTCFGYTLGRRPRGPCRVSFFFFRVHWWRASSLTAAHASSFPARANREGGGGVFFTSRDACSFSFCFVCWILCVFCVCFRGIAWGGVGLCGVFSRSPLWYRVECAFACVLGRSGGVGVFAIMANNDSAGVWGWVGDGGWWMVGSRAARVVGLDVLTC